MHTQKNNCKYGGGYKIIHSISIRFDCNSTALRPFDDRRNDRAAWVRLAGYVSVTLMTFDKQSNPRRTPVDSYSCNHRRCLSLLV